MNEPNGLIWPYLTRAKLPDRPRIPPLQCKRWWLQVHLKEAIRTNCCWVQQSGPGTTVYNPKHLWVPNARANCSGSIKENTGKRELTITVWLYSSTIELGLFIKEAILNTLWVFKQTHYYWILNNYNMVVKGKLMLWKSRIFFSKTKHSVIKIIIQ